MKLTIHTDGGSRGNPGEAAVGVVIEQVIDGKTQLVHQFGKRIGTATNNEAEYQAVIEALVYVINGIDSDSFSEIHFVLDSLLVCQQLKGIYKIKEERLRIMAQRIQEFTQDIGKLISYSHVLRAQNREADRLVNEALDTA